VKEIAYITGPKSGKAGMPPQCAWGVFGNVDYHELLQSRLQQAGLGRGGNAVVS
jgi:hypothetical protein